MRWNLSRNNATTPVPQSAFRLVVLIDRQCNGADPSILGANSGILTNMAGTNTDMQAFLNPFNGRRFKILFDKIYSTGHTGAGLAATDTFSGRQFRGKLNYYFKRGLSVEYDQSVTTGATGSLRTNNLLAFIITNDADNHTFFCNTRVRYTDN